jgi:predicted ribosomally synthesized peptide with SipW-like signal peptide
MRNIFLSVVVVSALVIAGVGGTLAGFSDTERSLGNYFEVGNMDLKVDINDGPWLDDYELPSGEWGLPPVVDAAMVWPCNSEDRSFSLHNKSDNDDKDEVGYAYMKFKDCECYEVYTTKFPEFVRPEPEEVAENGGILNNKWIDGMGPWGQDCTLADFVEIHIDYEDGELVIGTKTPWGGAGTVYLSDLCTPVGTPEEDQLWIYLGEILGCNDKYGNISTHISNWSEEEWNERFIDEPEKQVPEDYMFDDLPFNDWLTNLFMNDGVEFIIEFALVADPIPDKYCYNPLENPGS